ncbi:MAG: EutN/CcmL family microcompartment protein [Bacteroidota bacterium]
MIFGRVAGHVVATQKHGDLHGAKLLLVQPLDLDGTPAGQEILAVDGVGAGEGDLVIAIAEGGSARQVAKARPTAPIDVVIAGIVDVVEAGGKVLRLGD